MLDFLGYDCSTGLSASIFWHESSLGIRIRPDGSG
jgi:hypothetical protein